MGEFLMVDTEHKVLYCFIPKSGSTTWLNVLAEATSVGEKKHHNNSRFVHQHGYMRSVGIEYLHKFRSKYIQIKTE